MAWRENFVLGQGVFTGTVEFTAAAAASEFDVEADDVKFTGALAASTFISEQDDVKFDGSLEASTFDVEQDVVTLGIDIGSTYQLPGLVGANEIAPTNIIIANTVWADEAGNLAVA